MVDFKEQPEFLCDISQYYSRITQFYLVSYNLKNDEIHLAHKQILINI